MVWCTRRWDVGCNDDGPLYVPQYDPFADREKMAAARQLLLEAIDRHRSEPITAQALWDEVRNIRRDLLYCQLQAVMFDLMTSCVLKLDEHMRLVRWKSVST